MTNLDDEKRDRCSFFILSFQIRIDNEEYRSSVTVSGKLAKNNFLHSSNTCMMRLLT